MNKNYFLKKKLIKIAANLPPFLFKKLIGFFKAVFAHRTVVFVTKHKIKSFNLGPFSQICLILCALWIGNFFFKSSQYTEIINSKSEEIDNLKSANKYFEEEFENVNDQLKIVNNYLISISGNKHTVKAQELEFKKPENVKEEALPRSDKHTIREIKDANTTLSEIHSLALDRIEAIENAISLTGLNLKKMPKSQVARKFLKENEKEISLNDKKDLIRGQGGPSSANENILTKNRNSQNNLEKHLEKVQFAGEMDRLVTLEKLALTMPLSRPMKNYYISSGFGKRVDPITGGRGSHHGLDFVGPNNEKILSPSSGRVILAGRFSDYGNAIVIDHGFGITTRYGHLSAVKVAQGQVVKKGDVIALQGSTGRSTGSHLHYEVRYRNTPLNPKKFLEAGDSLFNNEKTAKYVNS